MTKVSLARQLAFDIYLAAIERGDDPDDLMDDYSLKNQGRLDRRDRNFMKELIYGSLRWHGKIFWILQHTSIRDLAQSSPEIRAALVCGTYQIYYMDKVPHRAAVNESVEYVRHKGQAPACSFVNGILRQIARKAEYFAKPDKEQFPADYLSVQFAYPKWIAERWLKQFRYPQTEKMLAANNQPPPYTVRINIRKTPLEQVHELQTNLLKREHTGSQRRPLRSALHLDQSPDTSSDSLFAQGFFTIQDEASQLISYLVNPEPNNKVLDICAGPGGKLGHIYELGAGAIELWALERDPLQFEKMQKTMSRLGHTNYQPVLTDFLTWETTTRFDKILLDAPCSGLGVLRRHPEGKWHKRLPLVAEKAQLQRQMLDRALDLLKPGGELIYSVCSHEPEEALAHVEYIKSQKSPTYEIVSVLERLPDYYKRYVTKELVLLIYSGNQDEMDGFAAFIVRRKES